MLPLTFKIIGLLFVLFLLIFLGERIWYNIEKPPIYQLELYNPDISNPKIFYRILSFINIK